MVFAHRSACSKLSTLFHHPSVPAEDWAMPKLRAMSWATFAVALASVFLITAAAQITTTQRVIRLPKPDSRHPVQQPGYPRAAKDRKEEGAL
jgi:hypothetical protein